MICPKPHRRRRPGWDSKPGSRGAKGLGHDGLDSSAKAPAASSVPLPTHSLPPLARFTQSHHSPFSIPHTHQPTHVALGVSTHYPIAYLKPPHPDWTILGRQHLLQEVFLALYSAHLPLAGLRVLSAFSASPDHHFDCELPSSFTYSTKSSLRAGTGADSSGFLYPAGPLEAERSCGPELSCSS